jgi:hypothetical protein
VARVGVWAPLSPGVYLRRPEHPWPLGEATLFAKARTALYAGLGELDLSDGEVLAPTWHHGSEIEALVRAGLEPRWYEGLEPDERELEALITPRTRALYLIHYLGFPQDGARWRRWCGERGLKLLEDCAMAWLATRDGQPAGSHGDLAIFCLYKTVGVPDGAALAGLSNNLQLSPGALGLRGLAWRHGAWLAGRLPGGRSDGAAAGGPDDLSLGAPRRPSLVSSALLTRAVSGEVAARRRANYRRLLATLQPPAPFAELPEGACPFAFPLETADKPALLARLAAAGVRALDFWADGHPSAPAHPWRKRIVALPVHHELRAADLDRIAAAAR